MNEKINLQELIGLLSEKAGITKKDAELFLREFFDLATNTLLSDKQVKIKDLGTFKLVDVNERESIDVRSGERVVIPAHAKVSYVPDSGLSKVVNEPFAMFEPVELEEEAVDEKTKIVSEEKRSTEPDEEPSIEPITTPIDQDKGIEETEAHTHTHTYINKKENEEEMKTMKESKNKKVIGLLLFSIAIVAVIIAHPYIKKFLLEDEDHLPDYLVPKTAFDLAKEDSIKQTANFDTAAVTIQKPDTSILFDATIQQKDAARKIEIPVEKKEVAQKAEPIVEKKETPAKKEQKNAQTQGVKKHTIAEGERLTVIALEEYGNKIFWVYLYEENKGIIKNPGNVPAGLTIVIPPASKYGIDKNNPESVKKASNLSAKH